MLKNITSLIAILALIYVANAQEKKIKTSEVPSTVTKSFKAKFPNVKEVEWVKEEADYEVEFEMSGKEHEAKFSSDGIWKETETKMKVSEIPQSVKTGLMKTEYKDWKIEKVAKVESADPNMKMFYEVEVEKKKVEKEICISADGKVLKVEDVKKY